MLGLFGCSSGKPIGVDDQGRLTPCPSSPNCVTSDQADVGHSIEPLRFEGDAAPVWAALGEILAAMPRTEIITTEERYLHAEATSRLLRFVDDVEFHLRPDDGMIAVRSASRIGRSDFGVNAERIEMIRTLLKERNLLI